MKTKQKVTLSIDSLIVEICKEDKINMSAFFEEAIMRKYGLDKMRGLIVKDSNSLRRLNRLNLDGSDNTHSTQKEGYTKSEGEK